jgi:PST family polysaccharide transporter
VAGLTIKNLKEKTIRGAFAKLCGQGVLFFFRLGVLVILGRLLEPRDFGLVGMVTAITGIFNPLRDVGISLASVQWSSVTDEQMSTSFWINMAVGTFLALLTAALGPFLAGFYHEPKLLLITFVLATGFILNAAGIQHTALLQRQMRFTALAAIDVVSTGLSTATGVVMALLGYSYWSLVAVSVLAPLLFTLGVWSQTAWVPGAPRKDREIHSMMLFGGTITLTSIVAYVMNNVEKVMLARFWGANALGLYGRAYQLATIPPDNLEWAVGGVAFASLSRVKDDAVRLKNYFLTAYSLYVSLAIPFAVMSLLFAEDIVAVILGPKWRETGAVLRLLAPVAISGSLLYPCSWLLYSTGLASRRLKMALVLSPFLIASIFVGLPYGPNGVAAAYSTVMMLWIAPHLFWCFKGTVVSVSDVLKAASRPLLAVVPAGAFGWLVHAAILDWPHPWTRLIVTASVFSLIYLTIMSFVLGQKELYLGLFRSLSGTEQAKVGAS